jgi:hypothetical protein
MIGVGWRGRGKRREAFSAPGRGRYQKIRGRSRGQSSGGAAIMGSVVTMLHPS